MKDARQPMRILVTTFLIGALAVGASRPAVAADAGEPAFSQPAGLVGTGAVVAGVASMIVGARFISQNADPVGDAPNPVYTSGPWGFVYLGAGAAGAMLGAALIDWAAVAPAQREGRSARVRRWSYAAIGAGTLLASLGGGLVMKEFNDRKDASGDSAPKPATGRTVGWTAAVIGTAVALVGIEGLAFDVFSSSTADGRSTAAPGLSFRGRF